MARKYELISLEQHGEWYICQFAIDGALTEAFWEHRSIHERCPDDDSFMSHLKSRADALFQEFGDIRHRGPIEEIRYGQAA